MGNGWSKLKSAGYRTALYRMTIGGDRLEHLIYQPHDPWPGDPKQADDLFRGRYRFAGREASAPNQPPWRLRPDDDDWLAELHGFDWLRHFAAAGGDTATAHARRLLRSWIDLCDDIDPVTWAPGVLGRRLVAWLSQAGFLLPGAGDDFTTAYLNSLALQWRHLCRAAADAPPGRQRLNAYLGVAYGALALPEGEDALDRAQRQLQRLVDEAIATDGGPASRAPSDLMALSRELIAWREALAGSGREAPSWLNEVIGRAAPMLRGLRHGDGGLALFNGGFEESAESVDITLARADVKGNAVVNAAQSGFQRLLAGRTLLLADTAAPPAGPAGLIWAAGAHAGGGSFELSVGKHRLVVNCGGGQDRNGDWAKAARSTAAHSTLVLDDANAFALDDRNDPDAARFRCRRHEDDSGSIWLELSHEGYRRRFGLIHRRRLYVDAGGGDLRGEDRLDPVEGAAAAEGVAGRAFAVRFHLHPDVQASAVQGGSAVLLKLANGQGWRFRANGGDIAMADSAYLGQRDRIRRGQQIVLSGHTGDDGALLKWAFRQV
ncbi:MAG: heparinase II/III family protein [Alphaproteobacteria bacterium]|jgi:uncharacterized heparinase superfamily protein|nr:heparinase II/III family protein [Alphaproteobacteria bacterium]MDP6566942.1 heparinase II/III family protein [Alphaproteobacteria bacterium]MDP6813742.1 heparinase II/III family protein [Alphaproteobacteria bacterium]